MCILERGGGEESSKDGTVRVGTQAGFARSLPPAGARVTYQ